MIRRVLIVSPHFPPGNAPDMQRVRMSLRHYRACGWEPVVLCADAAQQNAVLEPGLDATVPADVTVIRVPALSLRWTRLLGVGNLGLRCWLHFLFAGSRAIRTHAIDLVFFSNTQFVTFPLGRIWRRLHGVPYVFDLQDPWRTDYYSRAGSRPPPGGWKYQFARFTAWALEGWSFARVSGLVLVSGDYLRDLRQRYPWLAPVPAAVVPFGIDDYDLIAARRLPPSGRFARDHGEVHLVYTGAAGPIMPHATTVLFAALREYRAQQPEDARRLRLHFLGTSYVPPGQGQPAVMALAAQFGVEDLVSEVPHRLGYLECLQLQQEADALLLPGSNDPAYSPSKLYPYFLAGRPILGIVFADSVLEQLLDELNCAVMIRLRADAPVASAREEIGRFLDRMVTGFPPDSLPIRRADVFGDRYRAEATTRAQARIFDAAVGFRAAGHSGQVFDRSYP